MLGSEAASEKARIDLPCIPGQSLPGFATVARAVKITSLLVFYAPGRNVDRFNVLGVDGDVVEDIIVGFPGGKIAPNCDRHPSTEKCFPCWSRDRYDPGCWDRSSGCEHRHHPGLGRPTG